MNNKALIVTGLILFLIIVLFPFWYMRGKAVPAPERILTPKAKAAQVCVRSTDYMRAEHMQLLDAWRDEVVRRGKRVYVNPQGKEFSMSLTNTCMDCHANYSTFCQECHEYEAVYPICWDCHLIPEENK